MHRDLRAMKFNTCFHNRHTDDGGCTIGQLKQVVLFWRISALK